jgi:integrase
MVPTFQQEHRSAHRQKIKMPCRDMRIGEVLKLDPMDIEDRKSIIRDPKSGRESEVVFLPQKVADRLRDYIREKEIKSDSTIFPMTYAAIQSLAFEINKKALHRVFNGASLDFDKGGRFYGSFYQGLSENLRKKIYINGHETVTL